MIYALFGNMVRYDLERRDGTILFDAIGSSIKRVLQIFEVLVKLYFGSMTRVLSKYCQE